MVGSTARRTAAMTRNARSPSFLQRNGLSLVLLALFLVFLVGQVLTGMEVSNAERIEQGLLPESLAQYLASGHFISATFENWESEFLQMGMYVLLTVKLRQKGSAESRPLDPAEEEERIDPGPAPWPLRKGGWWARLYANSLSLAYAALFGLAFSATSGAAGCTRSRSAVHRDWLRLPLATMSPVHSSGSSRCRTGKASSLPCSRSWC